MDGAFNMFETRNGPFGGLRCIHLFRAVTTTLWAPDILVLSAHHPIYSPHCYCVISSNLCIQKRQVPAGRELSVRKEKTVQKERCRCQPAQQPFLPRLSSRMEPEISTSPHQTIWHWRVILSCDFWPMRVMWKCIERFWGNFLVILMKETNVDFTTHPFIFLPCMKTQNLGLWQPLCNH